MLKFYFLSLFVVSLAEEGKSKPLDTCGPEYFPCNDGSCVEKVRWCDSRTDCDDDSDEDYCYFKSGLITNPNRCNLTLFFLCGDGRCIPAIGRCDGYSSCDDNSDEEDCEFTSFLPNSTPLSLLKKPTEVSSTELNKYDPKNSGNLYDHENMMLADHEYVTEKVSIFHEHIPTAQSNISHDSSSVLSKQSSKVSEVSLPNVNVSKKFTKDLKDNFTTHVNDQQALEFRNLLGGILNTSQNISAPPSEFDTSLNLASSNDTSSFKMNTGNEDSLNGLTKNRNNKFNHSDTDHQNDLVFSTKKEDINKGYIKLHARDFQKAKEKALRWLIHSRKEDYGWGEETARALIALRIGNSSVERRSDDILMTKELHLKLFTLISRNETKSVPLGDLALYINALSASCDNPKNFYGHDLVNILRYRVDDAQRHEEFVNPLIYLALCLNNASSLVDVSKVRDMMYDSKINKTDIEALISLAATCLSRIQKFSYTGIGEIAARKLYHKVASKGLPKATYELALLTQALNEARVNQDLWNRTEAMHRIIHSQEKSGSFGDILSTYFAVPALSGKSFLAIGKHCRAKDTDLIPVEVLKHGKDEMYVHYSLRFGYPVEMAQSLAIMVQKNTSFMNIMRIASTVNPVYEFKFDETEGKIRVYSIGGITNDAEKGLYWVPYATANSQTDLVPFEGDIRTFSPARGDYIAFWRRPMF